MNRVKPKSLPISRLFPNIVTIMAICFGLTSIRYALDYKWEEAVSFIIIAGFLDVVDGRLARFLKATSNFGAQLDSLADFVNFGVAPAIVLYLWSLNAISVKGLGWALALLYVICSAIRLARFNTELVDPERADWKEGFFTGVPAPVGAYLSIMPIMLSFETNLMSYVNPIFIGVYLLVIGLLMASGLPTFSTKKLVIQRSYITLVLVLAAVLIGLIIMKPWVVLPIFGVLYVLTFPCSIRAYKRLSK